MAITVVGAVTVTDTGATNVDNYIMPAGIQAGDGALLFTTYASGAITQTVDSTALSTPLTQVGVAASFSGHQSQLYSVQNLVPADSGKVITITQSTSVRVSGVLIVYRGVSKTAMVNAFASKTVTVASTVPSTPTVVTTTPGCAEIGFVGATRGSSTPQISTITPPTGSTLGVASFQPAAGSAVTTAATASAEGHNLTTAASGATVGGDTYTMDVSAVYSAWTVALAPASGVVVDAGATQTVAAGATVTLSGTESMPAGTTVTARSWTALTYPGTTAPTLTGATTATATFTTVPGEYTFRYRVTDSTGGFTDGTVTVYATASGEARPVSTANAGEWTAVGAATIHAALADESATTYAESGDNPSGASFTVDLAPSGTGAKTINYTLTNSTGTPSGTVLVEYLSGGRVVASWNETVGATTVTQSRTLTDAQNALVTDPLNHQLRVTGTVA